MFTLVIADVHENIDWIEKVISQESPDEVVFLGDYFDSFVTTKETVKRTCDWLLESLDKPNRIHLFGNHDVWYAFPQAEGLICSGNDLCKQEFINTQLKRKDWDKFKLVYKSQKFHFCHGGLQKNNFLHPVYGFTDEFTNRICNTALEYAKGGQASPILQAGWARGGRCITPGITWTDWDCEFTTIVGVNQIVGHTPHNSPDTKGICKYAPNKKDPTSINYCVDFKGEYYTTVIDNKVNFEKTGAVPNNRRKHQLLGEPFIDGRKINECTQPLVQPMNPANTANFVIPPIGTCNCDDKIDGVCHHTHRID